LKKSDRTQLLLENKELFNAVVDEFACKTYVDASINEIIKRANYNKGSFYYRFDSKQDLFFALMDHIIVEQISLFKEKNYSISRMNKIEDTLFELYSNLISFHAYNKKFYNIITKYLGDPETNKMITENCAGPLINRFLVHLNRFSSLPHFENLLMVVKNLYYNFPANFFFDHDVDKKLKDLVNYLVAYDHKLSKKPQKSIRIENFVLEERVTYILTNQLDFTYPKDWISIAHDFLYSKEIVRELKKKVSFFDLGYKMLVLKLIKKSIKDINYYQKFINRDIIRCVKRNKDFEIFLLLILFRSLQESPIIVIDNVFDKFSQAEIQLFFFDILPIITKTSKIVVLSDEYEFTPDIPKFFILNESMELVEHSADKLLSKLNNSLLIDYIDDEYLHTEIIEESDLSKFNFHQYINKYKHVNIRTITRISYESLVKSEELI